MITKNKTINFFTNETNVSFVQNEIFDLSNYFERVNVFAFKNDEGVVFPKNVYVTEINYKSYSTKKVLSKNFYMFLSVIIIEFLKAPKYIFHIGRFKKIASELLRCFYLTELVTKENYLFDKDAINYTFWFNQWATVLSILKRNGKISSYVSRVHGADLFEDRVPEMKRIPFRWFQLKYVSKVFSVSKKGSDYLKNKYSEYSSKCFYCYLGTKDNGIAKFNSEIVFTIVTCANVRNIKRIHLVPKIIELLDFEVKWVHIGAENLNSKDLSIPEYKMNKELLKMKTNVQTCFLGAIGNMKVMDFYKTNNVNLYLSVSETEGLPVSMMEAISFGIPILATDVGGCNEIVNNETGILIPKDFDVTNVAEQIKKIKESEFNTENFRKGVREFWKKNFDGVQNMKLFIKNIEVN